MIIEPQPKPLNTKPSNPKDLFGSKKFSITSVPMTVLSELSVAMAEGAAKYGKHNYRVIGVSAYIYVDAAFRHISKWWEGEDIDEDSGLSHITKAIASLTVLRDAMIQGQLNDDRPPKAPEGWYLELDRAIEGLIKKYPNPVKPFTEGEHHEMVALHREEKKA